MRQPPRRPASRPPTAVLTTQPPHPVPAVSAVLIHDNCALLVQRGQAPSAGLWSFPGGKIKTGERVQQAALRELTEETGVKAKTLEILTVLDVMGHEAENPHYHYLLVVIHCRWLAGVPLAGDDAAAARWIPLEQLRRGDYPLTDTVLPVLDLALAAEQAAAT